MLRLGIASTPGRSRTQRIAVGVWGADEQERARRSALAGYGVAALAWFEAALDQFW
jgi:hypothetical protein